ncbi:MAG: cadherin repeat domain-containing protein, partial [Burkholderiales bacterium]|nr:cadherin repeat domain-containing protein [Burkholderiales bacterium]
TLGGIDASQFSIDSATGKVTLIANPDYEVQNAYSFDVIAHDAVGNSVSQTVTLGIIDVYEYIAGQSIIDLGEYGQLINPVHIDNNGDGTLDSWFYAWDMNGDGVHNTTEDTTGKIDYTGTTVTNASGTGFRFDYVMHGFLDNIFNHDTNGVVNTSVQDFSGQFGTTNDYRYGEINGVKLALPTLGDGQTNITSPNYRADNQSYSDLLEIWDSHNSGYQTAGNPVGWADGYFWSATLASVGHATPQFSNGFVSGHYDDYGAYVALQVL